MDTSRTYPTSPAQESMWFLQQLAGANDVYNETGALNFSGPFDVEAFARALELTFIKEPAFCSTFHLVDGDVRVKLRIPDRDELLEYHDLRALHGTEQDQAKEALISAFAHRPMDLATGPLGRFLMLRLADEEHQVVGVFHHIVADRITQTILLTDLVGFYFEVTAGQQPTVEPPTQAHLDELLGERVQAERDRIEGAFPHAADYWRSVVPADLGELALPFVGPRPAVRSGAGDYVPFSLDQSLREGVGDLADRLGVSKFIVMLSVYTLLLWRYSHADHVPVQVAMNTRTPEQAGDVGLFVNSIPVVSRIDDELTLEQFIRSVNTSMQGAFAFRTFPFARVVEIVSPERSGMNPLAQCSMTYSKHLAFDATYNGLRIRYDHVQKSGAKGDLALELLDHGDRYDGGFNYSTEVFDRATIERSVGHFTTLLRGILLDPQVRLRDVEILTPAEFAQLTGPGPVAAFDEQATLASLFDEQVRRTPHAQAVRFEGASLTFAELDQAATRLAHVLADAGVGPDVPVAVCLERSLELVIALVAIHKAGGAYLPLDPEDPPARRAFTIADTGATILLTFTRHTDGLATDAEVICLDEAPAWEAAPCDPLPTRAGPRNLAYVIFTSGSTGLPKGVEIEHRSVVNLLDWRQRTFPIGADDRLLHKTPYTFDPSVWQFFWPLTTGATLVLASPDGHRDLAYLAQTIDAERITVTQFVPSVLAELARCVPPGGGSTLRHVSVGGEALTREQARTFFDTFPHCQLVNTYGPAECTVESSYCVESAANTGTPTIGVPIDNATLYVLDDHLRPCAVGVVGELCIAGPLVGRGYRNRAERTAAAFVTNPFAAQAPDAADYARIYRSGDRARWNSNGELEFAGRDDDQVKIRGHRVELAEVDAGVGALPGVAECAVVARPDSNGHLVLVAYLVPTDLDGTALLDAAEMRGHLATELPDYMLPSAFVVVQGLPRTRHDKLDVAALPDPDVGDRGSGADYVAPRTPTERTLATIWADVLGLPEVGIDDDFFVLGGHSLLATRLVTRVGAALDTDLAVRALFDHPTVRGLAEALDRTAARAHVPAITGTDPSEAIPLSFSQQRLWFLDQFEPGNPAYNVPGALDISGPLDLDRLRAAITTLFARHETLRTSFPVVEGQAQQVVHPAVPQDFPVIDTDDAGTDAIIGQWASAPFDLATGPLLRVAVLRRSATDHTLIIVMHHIVSDAWSMGVFINELQSAYLGEPLPPLPLRYADYAAWQRRWLRGEVLEEHVGYWVRTLAGAVPLELPTDRPRPETISYRGDTLVLTLDADIADAVRRVSVDHGATTYMTLLGLLAVTLGRTANQEDLVIGSVIAGRNHPGIEGLIGFFVNTLALRIDLSGNPSFAELLTRLRAQSLAAGDHQDAPFEQVVDAVGGDRDTSRQALFDVMFVHHVRLRPPPAPEGFFLIRHQIPETTAKFDLTVTAIETSVGLRVEFNFASDLFDAATIERMAGHFRQLVLEVVADPNRRIGEYTMLTPAELQAIHTWNDTSTDYPAAATICDLFAEHVRDRPDSVAVTYDPDGSSLTFAELDARANQVAHLLQDRGVRPGRPVALLLDRSLEMVVGILGILKAGGAYVPLQPELPDARIAAIVTDTGARVLLSHSDFADRRPVAGITTLHLDDLPGAADTAVTPGTTPGDLAYVLYTSGSTGTPKGAMITLGAVVNLVHWHRRLSIGSDEVVLLKTPYDHDISVTELFIPLVLGARLVVAAPGGHRDPDYLADVVRRRAVSVVHFVPTMLREFVRAPGFADCGTLRHVFCGGEALSHDLIVDFTETLPTAALHNMYGPTETTDYTSRWEADPADDAPIGPIGRPIDNVRAYIVDRWNALVPVGTPGELCVTGVGVGRGYLGRPEQTARAFVNNPFDDDYPIMYRSGDVCRWRADGVMEFVRRDDGQVKIRGHRVETGEVEAVLNAHPAVLLSAVVMREDSPDVHRLVGYVAADPDTVGGRELRQWCAARLPEFAVPSVFVVLDELPRLANGKIDRNALPSPGGQTLRATAYVPPATRTERILAAIWSDVLGVSRVGAKDNFFELGGDSILSIRVVSKAREAGLRLAVRSVFQHETVVELAAHIDAEPDAVVTAEQGPVLGEYPTTPIQEWFFDQRLASPEHFNQSLRVPLPPGDIAAALAAVADHHDVFRLRFDGTARAEDMPAEQLWPLDHATTLAELNAGLDLREGPLARAGTAGDELLLVVHHLIVDAVSWRVLIEDLQTVLDGGTLPPKTTSYRAWARRLQEEAQDPALRDQVPFWIDQLDARAPFATDRANRESDAVTVRGELDAELTAHLLTDAHGAFHTRIDDLLLAALHRTFGQSRLGVDLESHGRSDRYDDIDISRTVGWFTSLYPIALDAPVGSDPAETIIAVKERLRAVPDRGVGYGVARWLARVPELDRPTHPIAFNYLGQLTGANLDLGGEFDRAPEQHRAHFIDVNAAVVNDQLQVAFTGPIDCTDWLATYLTELTGILRRCLRAEGPTWTPSDFPLAAAAGLTRTALAGVPADRLETIYPLTPLQQGMVFHSLLAPAGGEYVEQLSFTLDTDDPQAFDEMWCSTLGGFETFRSQILWHGIDEPLAVVLSHVEPTVEVLDWSSAESSAQDFEEFLALDRSRGVDLAQAPLWRLTRIRIAERTYRYVWTFHHVLLDGWSYARVLGIILRVAGGEAPPAPRAEVHDHAAWLARQDRSAAEAFWASALAGFTNPTRIDLPKPAPDATGQGLLNVTLDDHDSEQITDFARRTHTTANTVMQAAWALVLSIYAGQDDVVFGTTTSGRPTDLAGSDEIIGCLINTIPTRIRIASEARIGQWLREIQQSTAETRGYEYLGLTDIGAVSDVPSDTPLFGTILVFENFPLDTLQGAPEASVRDVHMAEQTNYDLTLLCAPGPDGRLEIRLQYNRAVYPDWAMEVLLGHVRRLLTTITQDPERRVSDLTILDAQQSAELLHWGTAASGHYPQHATIPAVVARWAIATPDACAVITDDGSLTYSALEARANRLARYLIDRRVGVGQAVGVCLDRGADVIVALLAILKAGAGYVPLDPAEPADRLAFMIADTGMSVVISETRHVGLLGADVDQILVDRDGADIAACPSLAPHVDVGPDDVAYCLFTSGSTGQPKGVLVTHRGVVRLLADPEWLDLSPQRPVLFVAPLGFDASTFDIWGPLLNGAACVVYPDRVPTMSGLRDRIARHHVDTVLLTTKLFNTVIDEDPGILRGVSQIVTGGESASARHWAAAVQALPEARLINAYGPTETSVIATAWTAPPTFTLDDPIRIGRPVAGTTAYVVGPDLGLLPVGVPGELCIGGSGVARGYLGRPDLTAAMFVDDPFTPGGRMYRSGDIVRWLPDGTLEFGGRRDDQVKIRGHRIELGEVAAVLGQHPDVRDVVVSSIKDDGGDVRLIAYIERDPVSHLSDRDLRRWCTDHLADFMWPAAFVVLDQFPVNRHGKIDRRALPEPDLAAAGQSVYQAPRNPTEEILVGIWSEVLDGRHVGIDDDFFAIGGHSLLATRVVSRIKERLGRDLPIRAVFDHPTVAELADLLASEGMADQSRTIIRADRGAPLPLSFAQERLWFLDQWNPGDPTYNIPAVVRLTGTLDVAALRRAFDALVARHESLRTTFPTVDGRPLQHIAAPASVPITEVDAATPAALEAIIAAETERRFDLAMGPLLQVTLVRVGEDEHVLIINLHHIISDGWSMVVLIGELSTAYSAGGDSPQEPLTVQYPDFAVWQREWLQQGQLERQTAYWVEHLADATDLELPLDFPRPAQPSHRGRTRRWHLDPADTARLLDVAKSAGATDFMAFLALTEVALARWANQDSFVIGSIIAGRNTAGVEGLIGFFVNTLALPSDVAGDPTFRELLHRVRATALGAYSHQDVPFEAIVDELGVPRDPARHPLFQVAFTLENTPPLPATLGDLAVEPLSVPRTTAKFDLNITVKTRTDGVDVELEYATDLFADASIDRFVDRLQRLLAAAGQTPDLAIHELPFLEPEDVRTQTTVWNDTDCEHPGYDGATLVDLLSAQAARTPTAPAVTSHTTGVTLTYADLDARANSLAHRLRALGVGPDVVVGMCLQRHEDMIIAIVAILKAGGAYVPVDPDEPAERQAFTLHDAAAAAVLTHRRFADGLPADVPIIALDELADDDQPTTAPAPSAGPDNLAYVIYTSGSTGRPKGVQIEHASIVNLLAWRQRTYPMGQGDTLFHKTPITFDPSVWQFLWPLITGARLLLATDEGSRDLPYQLETMLAEHVTHTQFVPSVLDELVKFPGLSRCTELVHVSVGGEALGRDTVAAFVAALPDARLINTYGPAECTIETTYYEATADDIGTPPIGRPVDNVRVYVLDEHLQLVPIGAPGELCIAGVGLMRGYLNRPEAQDAAIAEFDGRRIYRTGDFARWLPSGDLDFLGRRDGQVKIRGHRVETDEVTSVVRLHPAVTDAAVIVRTDRPGDHRLVAYIVGQHPPDAATLRTFCAERLPDYMLPAAVVALPALPLTKHGKLDVAALPAPVLGIAEAAVAPRSDVERVLAEIWQDVLGLESVGVTDNFFELGGDSILSIRIVHRALQEGLDISVQAIFAHQTIAALAAQVGSSRHPTHAEQGRAHGEVPLTPIQRRFFDAHRPEPQWYDQAVVVDCPDDIAVTDLRRALATVADHHDALRLRFPPVDLDAPVADSVGRAQIEADVPPEDIWPLIVLPATEDCFARTRDELSSFDLVAGPLAVAILIETEPRRLLVAAHHLVVDTVSWRILLEDLQTALAGDALPAKTTSFQHWARRLTEFDPGDDEVRYWRTLSDQEHPALPLELAGDENLERDAISATAVLPADTTRRLLTDAAAAYHTQINDLLLAALHLTLSDWTGHSRVVIDLEGHGREELFNDCDVSRTVGWFTSVFPLALEAPVECPLDMRIKAVKEQHRALPRHGIGFGILGLRDRVRTGTPPISFNYLGQVREAVSTDLAIGPERAPLQPREHVIDITAAVIDGALTATFIAPGAALPQASLQHLADTYLAAVATIVEHCTRADVHGWTPTDFPLAPLSAEQVDRIADAHPDLTDIFALTAVQHGMLYHSLVDPAGGDYVEQLAFTVTTRQPETFEAAWLTTLGRHGLFRSTIVWDGLPAPVHVVLAEPVSPLEMLDWSSDGDVEQRAAFEVWLADDRRRGFDFARPPWRLTRIRLAPDTFRYCWTFHHLLMDGWSNANLFGELAATYADLTLGATATAPPGLEFREYVAWLHGQDQGAAEDFWRAQLADVGSVTSLDLPPRTTSAKGQQSVVLDVLDVDLAAAAERLRVTRNTLLQGAWAYLLHRYTDSADITFGVTTSGRPDGLPGADSIIGCLINTLPLRVAVPGDLPVAAFLTAIQDTASACRSFDYLPLPTIARAAGLPADTELFTSILVFENAPLGAIPDLPGIRVADIAAREQTNYPLTVVAESVGAGLSVELVYDAAVYDATAIDHVATHLGTILRTMAANPALPLAELPMVAERELTQLAAWNDTEVEFGDTRTFPEMVDDRAAQCPDHIAVESDLDGTTLSYRELTRRAAALAARLVRLGVDRDDIVALTVERSPEMVIGMLGIAKSGAAYTPVDPGYPQSRRDFICRDTRARVAVTVSSLRHLFADDSDLEVVCIDDLPADPPSIPLPTPDPTSLAYVIYTSGSTGAPKGVLIEHRNLTNFLLWQQSDAAAILPGDRVLITTPYTFDALTDTLHPGLVAGATLVLAAPQAHRDPEQIAAVVTRRSITTCGFVPSQLVQLLEQPGIERATGLRALLVGGEELPRSAVEAARRRWPQAVVINLYGPTEATNTATMWVCDPNDPGDPPIGRPVANTQAWVVDAALRPMPVGVPGELCIGGAGVTRGYLDRPDRTADAFVPNPFGPGRLYRTGDRVRLRADGAVMYLGRADDQVKLRGNRIELTEVASVLLAHPDVTDAAAIIREDHPGDQRLVGYVVTEGGDDLRQWCAERLPAYAVPSPIVAVPAIPRTHHGKLDGRALPAPERAHTLGDADRAEPRTPTEARVAAIWAQVLGVASVGVESGFYELGGHSLLATRVISEVNRSLGVSLPVRIVLSNPTVRSLAAQVDAGGIARASYLVTLRDGPPTTPLILLPAAGDLASYRALTERLAATRPVWGLLGAGWEPAAERPTSLDDLITRYANEVRSALPEGPYLLAGWSMGGVFALELGRRLAPHGAVRLTLLDSYTESGFPDSEALEQWLHLLGQLHGGDDDFAAVRRANAELLVGYRVPFYTGRVDLYASADGEDQQRRATQVTDWRSVAPDLSVTVVPGDHQSMLTVPHVEVLARALSEHLGRSGQGSLR